MFAKVDHCRKVAMAYTVLRGKVGPDDVAPPEEPEDDSDFRDALASAVELPLKEPCAHGFHIRTACYMCNPLPVKRLPTPEVSSDLYDDIYPWYNLKIGAKVCRRIRTNEIGTVTNITYAFTNSHHMREIWIDFGSNSRSTPYSPNELFQLKVQ